MVEVGVVVVVAAKKTKKIFVRRLTVDRLPVSTGRGNSSITDHTAYNVATNFFYNTYESDVRMVPPSFLCGRGQDRGSRRVMSHRYG